MEQNETIEEKSARVDMAEKVRRFRSILACVKVLMSAGFSEEQAVELIIAEMHSRGLR